ncbi:MAG: tetratricopeptide repeat protein, partial [Rhodothermales bacterium]|nr:tetratricopeptide repeat protein [Rhodothermales bacterium]
FWAPWCGPCRILGPVLEELASKNGDAWTLVKVNTDQHQELSVQYGIRGIPAVKMFVGGKVVDEFTGALPKHAVEQWLARAIPSKSQNLIEDAARELKEGNSDAASALLHDALRDDPSNAAASVMLAQLTLFDDPADALRLVDGVEIVDPILKQVAEGIAVIARLRSMSPPDDGLPDGDGRASYVAAIESLAERDIDGALESFVDVIQANRYYDEDGARKACLALFSMLGEDHPVTRKHRPQFNMALY